MNSDLNPEAPEFISDLQNITTDGYTIVCKTVTASNAFPRGISYKLFNTIPSFQKVTFKLRTNTIEQNNLVIQTEFPSIRLKQFNNEFNAEKIADFNDNIVDRVNIAMDILTGVNKQNQVFADSCSQSIAQKPVRIHRGPALFIGGKNIPPPQLSFKDPVDNSDRMWVPKISDKPNSIKPLDLKILYNEEGEAVGYEHPYKLELNLFHPPECFLAPDEAPPVFPLSLEDTKLTILETEAQIDELVKTLQEAKEIAVDVEHHSYRSYHGFTCLLQLSTRNEDFIIDALAAREYIHKLNIIFTDPKKLKIFHGAEMDVVWLQRDFGLYIVGMFDTHQAARVLNLPTLSLGGLLLKYCGVTANKAFQLADWRIRPLSDELIQYARTDTHYLIYIWECMKSDLLKIGNPVLVDVFDRSRRVCKLTYRKQVINDSSHLPLYIRSGKNFNSQQMAALRVLYQWRDTNARLLDEGTHYILPNFMMLNLAEQLPREVQGVVAICSPMPPFVKQNLITVHRMLLSCRQLPLQPILYPLLSTVTALPQRSLASYNFHDLTYFDHNNEEDMKYPEPTINSPDVRVFRNTYRSRTAHISELKVDYNTCISPFDRYRKYRSLAQAEEIKDYEKKEAEITELSKGNELIKKEVLQKLQQAKLKIQNEVAAFNPYINPVAGPSNVNVTRQSDNKEKKADTTVKSYYYKNSNYKKFYSDKY